jgi:hypothetical protein
MQVFTIGFLGVCYIAAEVSQGKARALLLAAAFIVAVLLLRTVVWRRHFSQQTPLGVHRYPGWFGTSGYVLGLIPAGFLTVGLVNYLRGVIVLKNLLLVSAVAGPVLLLMIWSSNRNRRLYRDVIVDERGLTATVLRRKWLLFSARPDSAVPWSNIEAMERSEARDWDSMSMGAGGPGIRLRLKDGGRILIVPSITGFGSLTQTVESHLKAR